MSAGEFRRLLALRLFGVCRSLLLAVKHENRKQRCMIFVFHRRIVNVKRSRPKKTLSLLDSQLTDTSSPSIFHCSDKIDFFLLPTLADFAHLQTQLYISFCILSSFHFGGAGCWVASAAASQWHLVAGGGKGGFVAAKWQILLQLARGLVG
jgi:hypothetical protein